MKIPVLTKKELKKLKKWIKFRRRENTMTPRLVLVEGLIDEIEAFRRWRGGSK